MTCCDPSPEGEGESCDLAAAQQRTLLNSQKPIDRKRPRRWGARQGARGGAKEGGGFQE